MNASRYRHRVMNSGIQSLDRALAILRSTARRRDAGIRLAEIVTECALNRSTAHRFMQALAELGLLTQDLTGRYAIGPEIVRLAGHAPVVSNRVVETAAIRRRLAEETGDTVFLSESDGAGMTCTARDEGHWPVKVLTLDVGTWRPLGVGAGGIALLGAHPAETRAALVEANAAQYSAFGLDPDDVLDLAEAAATRGYAVDRGRVLTGVTGIGVVLPHSASWPAPASLSIAATSDRMTDSRIAWVAGRLREAAGYGDAGRPALGVA